VGVGVTFTTERAKMSAEALAKEGSYARLRYGFERDNIKNNSKNGRT
jgi:hypothetical protein